MKKILTILSVLIHTCFLTGQVSSDLKVYLSSNNPNLDSPAPGSLVNHDTIYCSDPSPTIICRVQYVNTSPADTYQIALRRYIIYQGPSSSSAMTYGAVNYPPGASTTLATTNQYNDTLDAELDYFTGDLGTSIYLYHFFNVSDSSDFVDITVEFTTWEGIEEYSDLSRSIYPNPTNGDIKIGLKQPVEKGELIVFDLNGKKWMTRNFTNENQLTLSTENLVAGSYRFIILDSGHPKYRGTFIRE